VPTNSGCIGSSTQEKAKMVGTAHPTLFVGSAHQFQLIRQVLCEAIVGFFYSYATEAYVAFVALGD
jgi:hypothetical protein